MLHVAIKKIRFTIFAFSKQKRTKFQVGCYYSRQMCVFFKVDHELMSMLVQFCQKL